MLDVLVVGAGPAGVVAALRAADLGARTALVTRDDFGGMAANDGPVPVRTLAHAARLLREARQLALYGIRVNDPVLDYPQLLARVREVVGEVRTHSAWRDQLQSLGVTIHEKAGAASFVDPHTLKTASGLELSAKKIILCTGGMSRRLAVPGFEWTSTHSDAWALSSVPDSMIVLGAGATGVQVASIFSAFGTQVQLFQSGPRILSAEDEEISVAVAEAFRRSGIEVRENFGEVRSFERTSRGLRMHFSKDGRNEMAEASLVVAAVGWVANVEDLILSIPGVEANSRGFVQVDPHLQTTAPHIFAAGDITGRRMLVPQAMQDGFAAATNALRGPTMTPEHAVNPVGSFTDPEYAQVGATEAKARETHDVVTAKVRFDTTARTLIDGRAFGFCKLIVDRKSRRVLGCHVVGERAVDIVQVAAILMAAGTPVDSLAFLPLSFPTYVGILGRAAAQATRQLNLESGWRNYED